MNEGKETTYYTAANMGLAAGGTDRCAFTVAAPAADGSQAAALVCALSGNPAVNGAQVQLGRSTEGVWTCNIANRPTGWKESFLPSGCTAS